MKQKERIPEFKSIDEERKFWQKHNVTDFEELKPVKLTFPKPKHILVTLKPGQIASLKRIASKQNLPYQTLIQKWLTKKLQEATLHS